MLQKTPTKCYKKSTHSTRKDTAMRVSEEERRRRLKSWSAKDTSPRTEEEQLRGEWIEAIEERKRIREALRRADEKVCKTRDAYRQALEASGQSWGLTPPSQPLH